MVRTKATINFSWPTPKPRLPRYDLELLSTDAKEPFQLKLSNRFSALCETAEPEDICEEITSGILDSVKETLPLQNSTQPQWMSSKTKAAINTKHKTRKEKGHQSIEYKIAKAESKKFCASSVAQA